MTLVSTVLLNFQSDQNVFTVGYTAHKPLVINRLAHSLFHLELGNCDVNSNVSVLKTLNNHVLKYLAHISNCVLLY